MYSNSEALVLRRQKFSETSLLLTLFSRDLGRVDALAKGARRPRSPLLGHFDLFSIEEVTIFTKRRGGLDLATDAALVREPRRLRRDYRRFAAAGVIADLLLAGTVAHDPHPGAYAAARAALEGLEEDPGGNLPLLAGVLEILCDFGFQPRADVCPVCRKPPCFPARLSGRQGGVTCAACEGAGLREGEAVAGALSAAEVAALRYLLSHPGPGRASLHLPARGEGLLAALGEYARTVLERPLRSFDHYLALSRQQTRILNAS